MFSNGPLGLWNSDRKHWAAEHSKKQRQSVRGVLTFQILVLRSNLPVHLGGSWVRLAAKWFFIH